MPSQDCPFAHFWTENLIKPYKAYDLGYAVNSGIFGSYKVLAIFMI